MEEKGSLGIYLSSDKAVAVWIGSDGVLTHKLCVNTDAQEPAGIALQAARAVSRQGFAFDEVFTAVDCGLFTQYNLTSEFDDYKQIESTIKFDVEEAAASDAMNMAVAFEITGKEAVGSSVTVYTADRQRLTDILLDLQEGGIDPTLIEPDVVTLTRALSQTGSFSQQTDSIFLIVSKSNCYMLRPRGEFAPAARTFLIGGSNIDGAIAREILMARASGESQQAVNSVIVVGQTKSVDTKKLEALTGLTVKTEMPGIVRSLDEDAQTSCHELLIAYGAALAAMNKAHRVDFRRDFMPYQGQRRIMEGSLRVMSIALTVLFLAVGIFFQIKAFKTKGYAEQLAEKNLVEHKAVMFGRSPLSGMQPSSNLKREYTRVKNVEQGIGLGDDKSIPARLTYFFEAVNNSPANVDFVIQQVTVTGRSMKVKGDTNSHAGTMALLNEIRKHPKISIGPERLAPDGARYTFEISIEPKK